MTESPAQLRSLLTGPVCCALVLAGILVDDRRYRTDADCDVFHRRAKAAVESIPTVAGDWVGQDHVLPAEELALLQPNAYRYVAYTDTRPPAAGQPQRQVWLLVDQCKWANNMSGHYPPNCYPAHGDELCDVPANAPRERPGRLWTRTIHGVPLHGTEYFFQHRDAMTGQTDRKAVYDFMALPQQGTRPDMESVVASAEDYQQRYYGAAQVQFVFDGDLAENTPQARVERDRAFSELIGPWTGVVTTLCDGVLRP